ncbi:MAG TPA: hypothetical protein VMY37_33530 [Thermoguttaceae bacterium]|nr:hypothetical protein [Thermoguttaceae bacterium]
MNAEFRLSRSLLGLGVLCTAFFAAMAVVSVLGIYFEAPPERRAAALLAGLGMAGFWLAFMALSVWLLLAYWRHRLTIRDEEIDYVGVIRHKRIRPPEIVSARWRCWPQRGSLVLKTVTARVAIDFGDYGTESARQLIRFFRESVPLPLQTGWELFYVRIGKRVARAARQPEETAPGEGEVLLTRRRFDVYFLIGTLLAGATAVGVYHATGDSSVSVTLVQIPAIWLVVRFMWPRKGMVSKRATADSRHRFALVAYLWLFGGMACCLLFKAFFPDAAARFMIAFFVVTFAGIFTALSVLDRRRRREERKAIEDLQRRGRIVPEELLEP